MSVRLLSPSAHLAQRVIGERLVHVRVPDDGGEEAAERGGGARVRVQRDERESRCY